MKVKVENTNTDHKKDKATYFLFLMSLIVYVKAFKELQKISNKYTEYISRNPTYELDFRRR